MCKFGKNLINKLVEKCSEDISGNEMIHNMTLNDYGEYVSLVQYTQYHQSHFQNNYRH